MSPTPHKDCLNCRRRRIRCDRTVPACRKCGSRSLDCPGYGIDIKWKPTAGVGQQPQQDRSTPPESSSSSVSTPGMPIHRQPLNLECLITRVYRSMPQSMRHARTLQLLQHYVQNIAPSLALIDGPENVFREAMLSICTESTSVQYALLALTAGDLAARSDQPSRERGEVARAGEVSRDAALTLIASDMNRLAREGGDFVLQDPGQARSMLASLFLLVNMGIRVDDYDMLRLHLRTTDVVIQSWISAAGPTALSESNIDNTMIHMLCDTQIWCSTTTSAVLPDRRPGQPSQDSSIPLSCIVMAIHSITELERLQLECQKTSSCQLDRLLNRLWHARGRALQRCAVVESQNQQCLESLVDMYYQAALVYLYRVCMAHESAEVAAALPTRLLFDALRELPDLSQIAHHLAWPLFIAGTESCGNAENQTFIEAKLGEIIHLSGTLGRPRLMEYLSELWKREGASSDRVDWIEMAKEWEQRGTTLTIF